MENELVSVIMPVYNAANFLKAAVCSVLNQTYQNFELIAVNDGSSDNSLEILRSFTDKRIKIIDKKNTGVSDTRNCAIKAARGKYICFIDADDCYSPNYIEKLHCIAVDHHADMVVCSYTPFQNKPCFPAECSAAFYVESAERLISAGVITSVYTKFIKAETLRKNNILFDSNLSFGEDLFFCWKAYIASQNVWMTEEKLYGYRIAYASATSKYHPRLYEKYKAAFADLKEFGRAFGKNDEYTMDVFFATRMPSFVLMTVREKSSLHQKRQRLSHILSDVTIQNVYQDWDKFIKQIGPGQMSYYDNCRKKRVWHLLLDGYRKALTSSLKRMIRRVICRTEG